ncbi:MULTISPECIES: hypothetical protein [unclassified Streptomyces]|uniref:hypothetical protein n=1 Tax=unclassified Streptomyces TaxID=2593676 RepID=UPI0009324A63|nr:hypothetical protein [Streptomyces sp. NBRC 110465]
MTLPTVTDADAGPNVEGDEFARIHISMPTTHFPAARGLATSGPVSFIKAAARRATASGSHTVRAPCAFGQIVQEPGINSMAQGIAGLLDSGEFEQALQRLDDE